MLPQTIPHPAAQSTRVEDGTLGFEFGHQLPDMRLVGYTIAAKIIAVAGGTEMPSNFAGLLRSTDRESRSEAESFRIGLQGPPGGSRNESFASLLIIAMSRMPPGRLAA